MNPARLVFGSGGWASYARVFVGVVLVVAAMFIIGFDGGSLQEARLALLAGGLGVVGPAVRRGALGLPAVHRPQRGAGRADPHPGARRRRRAPARLGAPDPGPDPEELRATPATVARLARAQERDLRSWLYAGEATDDRSVASALRGAAAEVEDAHGVSVDVVAVGDCAMHETPAADRRRGPRGDDQRGQARGHRPGRRLRRGRRHDGVRLRPRPRRGLRPRRGARGPAGRAQQHRGPDGPARRLRRGPLRARRGHRDPAPAAPARATPRRTP